MSCIRRESENVLHKGERVRMSCIKEKVKVPWIRESLRVSCISRACESVLHKGESESILHKGESESVLHRGECEGVLHEGEDKSTEQHMCPKISKVTVTVEPGTGDLCSCKKGLIELKQSTTWPVIRMNTLKKNGLN